MRKFAELFGSTRANADIPGIARAAAREGYAVLPVRPGTKQPMCTLPRTKVRAADRLAANAAKVRGRRHWELTRHDCGRTHAITDPDEAHRVFTRLMAAHSDLNIGIEVGRSRVITIDCDTAAEVASFTELWAERDAAPAMANAAPTVRSPGKQNEAGEWVHADGGHFHFLLPDGVELPTDISVSMPIGADPAALAFAMYADSLVLVPPSVRDEGPYV
ncbi:MAG TPA: bifunctional DNA primase/polymerase, partial [Pseudonocardia sp.]|uniref:bifunctional DNA primase/polymerase n=1 Tax=Pseudonocardia sp. TaxID=60912 RepID=UPI002BB44386